MMPQGPEWIIILVVVLVLFGGAKLPKLARSLGEAKNEFEKSTKSGKAEPVTAPAAEPEVKLTKAEYDALVAQRDAAKKD